MKHLRFVLVAMAFFTLVNLSPAQLRTNYFFVGLSAGVTNYKGDLDDNFTFKFTKPGLGFLGGYKFHPHMSVRVTLNQGWVGASDKYASFPWPGSPYGPRLRRNLSFRSPVTEFAATVVYEFFGNSRKYKYRPKVTPYLMAGIGVFAFKPQAKLGNEWIDLQPLGTEGQFLPSCKDCPKPYKLVQICIPMGIGVRYKLTEKIDLWAEIGLRKTFTDYMDDVSGFYVDHWGKPQTTTMSDNLRAQNPVAYQLADRMDRATYPEGGQYWNGIRGDNTQMDWYVLSMVTGTYILDWVKCPKFR